MTGRGRPRKAKSPDTKCVKSTTRTEEMKQVSLPRRPGKDFKEERKNGCTKEQKQSAKEVTKTQPEAPKDTRKASVKTTKAKTSGGETKATELAEGTTKTQPKTPKDTTNYSLQITKPKSSTGKVKSPVQLMEEVTKLQPEERKYATKASIKTTTAKTKTCEPQDGHQDKAAVDSTLFTTLKKLTIKRNDRADAADVINKITTHIIKHLKQNTQCFKEVEEPLRTGSYYENLKISSPDEFDVMLPIPVDRVTITPFGDDGAFYSVALKRDKSPLQVFQETSTLSGSKMLKEFRVEVKKCVKEFKEWEVTKKKKGCPAVTLITNMQSVTISLDVVLSLVVKSSWPSFTKEGLQIEGWLGTKVKQEHKRKPYYLVPKYEGRGTVENDGVFAMDVWRISFSHVEKAILKSHGSEKTCCEKGGARCCRKDCLKLLKHLLSLLKEKDPSFNKFCSYHTKTTLLHACCSRTKDSEWRASSLGHCFRLLLEDFLVCLEEGVLHNFFIPTQNLLSGSDQRRCSSLALCIREECEKGFPIFK